MEATYKLGSLFDGSGGFPLSGALCGIKPVWAAEIEPYPIAVTSGRFPNMKHLGDISKINGAEIEPVDIITFGSPCQDLSVAGKRAGLKHTENGDDETTRSGLFMEAVRIIKEMREATNGTYPRFALWENVPGAFSSNKGEDFRIVLEELIKIVEPTAVMPTVPKNGWPYADSYCGDGWSVAYRVFDAQYWGVPQRRRRIYLVADFRGKCAGKVLFEREGLRGYFAESGTPRQGASADAERGVGADDCEGECVAYTMQDRAGKPGGGKGFLIQKDRATSLRTGNYQYVFQPTAYSFDSLSSNSMKSKNPHSGCRQVDVSKTLDTTDPNPSKNQGGIAVIEMIYDARGNGDGAKASTITGDHENRITDYTSVVVQLASGKEVSGCLMASGYEKLGAQEMFSGDYTVIEKQAIPIHDQATRFSGKRGDKTDGKGNGLGVGEPGDPMNTLTAGDRHSVAYSLETFHCTAEEEKTTTLKARDYKDPTVVCYSEAEPIAIDRAFFNQGQNALYDPQYYEDGTVPTLVARGPSAVAVRYIVRRLTPTECARLQGFADRWGDIEEKTEFSNEEYLFWLEVRNTHAAINGKAVKDYTEQQMLNWYNKLHTDSSEYKMWGNGISLPTAVYCMQGIAEVLFGESRN